MPNMFGGDQLSEDYAPWFHEKARKEKAEEEARQRGEIATVEVHCTWTTTHRIDVPEGMFKEMFIEQINAGQATEEVMDQLTTQGADLTSWEAS